MPWVLVMALVAAVAYALGASNHPPESITATPSTPRPQPGGGGEMGAGGMGAPDDTAEAPESQENIVGTVLEAKDVSQYTYLRLATDQGETWAAVYRTAVKVGAKVTVQHATALHTFHSRELNRDFETIWFGTLPGHETAPGATATSSAMVPPSASGTGAVSGAGYGSPSATPPLVGVAGNAPHVAGAIAIADLAKKASSLEGKQATVVGTVVKVNDGIMGRNWIHLQDGTGNAANKTNDVLVTTDEAAEKASIGSVVVATGTVKTKQDFGSGYAYDFMLEQASVAPPPSK
jgi:hypothetical protein